MLHYLQAAAFQESGLGDAVVIGRTQMQQSIKILLAKSKLEVFILHPARTCTHVHTYTDADAQTRPQTLSLTCTCSHALSHTHANTNTHTHHTKVLYQWPDITLQHTATHCNTLQHTATRCNTLQHNATHYSTIRRCYISGPILHCNIQINSQSQIYQPPTFPTEPVTLLLLLLYPQAIPKSGLAVLKLKSISRIAELGQGPLTPEELKQMAKGYSQARDALRPVFEQYPPDDIQAFKLIFARMQAADRATMQAGQSPE